MSQIIKRDRHTTTTEQSKIFSNALLVVPAPEPWASTVDQETLDLFYSIAQKRSPDDWIDSEGDIEMLAEIADLTRQIRELRNVMRTAGTVTKAANGKLKTSVVLDTLDKLIRLRNANARHLGLGTDLDTARVYASRATISGKAKDILDDVQTSKLLAQPMQQRD